MQQVAVGDGVAIAVRRRRVLFFLGAGAQRLNIGDHAEARLPVIEVAFRYKAVGDVLGGTAARREVVLVVDQREHVVLFAGFEAAAGRMQQLRMVVQPELFAHKAAVIVFEILD